MNPDQIRKRMEEIQARLTAIMALADITDVEEKESEELHGEFASLEKRLTLAEKNAEITAKTQASAGRKVAPTETTPRVTVEASRKEKMGGFSSAAAFLNAVKEFGVSGKRAPEFNNVMFEKAGEDGGFLVPEELNTDILKKLDAPESLWSRANTTPVSGNSMSMMVDEAQPWNGGVQAYWTAEGAPITESQPKLSQAHFRLHKLAAMVKVTDELLDDAVALEAFIRKSAGEAIMHRVNEAMLTGNGVGKPQGLLNSPFAVTVPAEGGQPADTIVAANIINMYSRLLPQARAGAVWIMNAGAAPQLNGMKDADGNYIFLRSGTQMNQGPFDTLLGLPILPMMSALPALGDVGDIALVNFSYYYGIFKSGGIKSSMSTHLHFDRDITAFKWTFRLDGKSPFQTPVTTQYGNYQMSAFVKLAAR